MTKYMHCGIGILSLTAGVATTACYQGEVEDSPEATGNTVGEVHVSATKRILFIDLGNGDVGVAEISRMGEAPVVTTMIREMSATPLEIFLATASEREDIPELLVENHRYIAATQGREDLGPRRREAIPSTLGTLAWDAAGGITSCDEDGWEGPGGIWGDPVDSWDNIFFNSTSEWNSTTSYPKTKTITQSGNWNGGSGAYHTHGACLGGDSGADNKITITVNGGGDTVPANLFEVNGDNWATFTRYIGINGQQTKSTVTNVGNSAASFRHSAAAWVPFPG